MPTEGVDWTERSGHVIVCGLHDDGLRMVEQLHVAGVPALVVDDVPEPAFLPLLAQIGVPWLAADAQLAETLSQAGLAGAAAIVCAESDDLRTLATALLARELQPEVRVVVQLRNAAVGRALGGIGVVVLDAAGLAAPSVVDACLGSTVFPIRVGDQDFLVVQTRPAQRASLRAAYGDLAPLALVHDGGEVEISPGRDSIAGPGDTVVLVAPTADLRAAGLVDRPPKRVDPVFVGARAPREPRPRPTGLLQFFFEGLDRRIKLTLAALLALAVVSVIVLSLGYQEADGRRMTVLDALYFTVETIGTVGYGDFYFRDQTAWLRLWAVLLMVVGATLATTFFALITNLLISRTIAQSLGRRKVTGLSDHVIVVGVGAVGLSVVERLREAEVEVVVIESDDQNRFLAQLRTQHVPVIIADATLSETWSSVRLEAARAVAVMTSDDLANIETGLAVRDLLGSRWLKVPVVVRLFDRRLAHTISSSFDFRNVRSPSALAAPWFVGAALGLDVLHTLDVGGQLMLVARLTVPPGSSLEGTAMRELSVATRVVSLHRAHGDVVNLPRRDTRFEPGDVATLIGPYEEMLQLLRESARAR